MTKDVSQKSPAPGGGEARPSREGRPPVIVVLGHVDHGKTTLLDYIRKTNVAARAASEGGEPRPVAGREAGPPRLAHFRSVVESEAGGITQSIGAYEITHQSRNNAEINAEERGKIQRESAFSQRSSAEGDFTTGSRKITFIDTPGHEAFSKMRTRGAKIADLAILVVAADDGVKPQTKESINILQESKTPFVVAINKIDKQGVDINNVKNGLTAEGVLLEGYGGNVSVQPISAKTGQGVKELLDLLLLAADLEDLKFNPRNPARGVILESKLESRRGIVATAIVKDGTLKVGDSIVAGGAHGKIKSLENFLGKKIKEAIPSMPVLISGFLSLPEVGEEFFVGEAEAKDANQMRMMRKTTAIPEPKKGERIVNLILKADVSGSLEALSQIIQNLLRPEGVLLKILDQGVGEITDGDVKTAIPANAIIIGFKIKPTKAALNLAQAQRIKIITSDIIYELLKALELEFSNLGKTVIKGKLEILGVFGKKDAKQQIVGGRVLEGELINNSSVEIQRRESVLGTGKILNLQQAKKDVGKVPAGSECGLLVDTEVMIKAGDHLILR